MEEVLKREKCTGCTACFSICPVQAIEMSEDLDGFKYPIINQNKCINCGLCKKTCPVLNTKSNFALNECYATINKNKKIALESSSSGLFTLIAQKILKEDGIVIGATFENNKLIHKAISEVKDLEQLRRAKYLQSDLGNIFSFIKKNIKDRKILFVGTPCQVAGLKRIIKDNENLFTIDFICHGVPTPKLFQKYVKELEEKYNDKLISYNFRDKETGWDTYSNSMIFKTSKHIERAKDNSYMNLFLSDKALRESCYNCNFKLGNKYSDITSGDFWGIKKVYPDMYDKTGVSSLIINSAKGRKMLEEIKKDLILKECQIENIFENNKSLIASAIKPFKRKLFLKDIDTLSIESLNKKYKRKDSLLKKIYFKLKIKIKKYKISLKA